MNPLESFIFQPNDALLSVIRYAESLGTRTANMMQLLHHYQNTDGPNTCVPGKDQLTYCKGIYGLGNSTGNGKFSTHIDGFIMDRYVRVHFFKSSNL